MKRVLLSRSVCFLVAGLLTLAWSDSASALYSSDINGTIQSGGPETKTIDEGGVGRAFEQDAEFSSYTNAYTGTSYHVEVMARSSAFLGTMGGYLSYQIQVPETVASDTGAYGYIDNYFTDTFVVGGDVDPAPVIFSATLNGIVHLVGIPSGGCWVGASATYQYIDINNSLQYVNLYYSSPGLYPYFFQPINWGAQQQVLAKVGTTIRLDATLSMDMNGSGHLGSSIDWNYLDFYDSFKAEVLPGIEGVTLTSSAAAHHDDELAMDFGSLGLYHFDGSTMKMLNPNNAIALATYANKLVANFPGSGLYEYDGTAWKKLNSRDSQRQMCGTGTTLYVDFGVGIGLYKFNGKWSRINTNSPKQMWVVGTELYADFGAGVGLYKYSGTKWQKMNPNVATALCAVGSDLYIHFAGVGLYKYDGSTWKKINPNTPQQMVPVGSDLYVDFGSGVGLYKYNGTWARVNPNDPEKMLGIGATLYVDFGGFGLYKYEGGVWRQINPNNADGMRSYADKLVVNFPSIGLYEYNGSAWRKVNPNTAEDMIAVNLY